jgi:hypothetical protein
MPKVLVTDSGTFPTPSNQILAHMLLFSEYVGHLKMNDFLELFFPVWTDLMGFLYVSQLTEDISYRN